MPSRPTGRDAPVRVHDQRQRMAAAGQLEADAVAPDPQVGVTDRAEAALVAGLVAQRAVQQGQDARRPALVGGRGAHRVARERGHRGRVRALALDVADQRRPGAVTGFEEVVEVAAELDPLAGGAEAHRGAEPGHGRERPRPQRALQRARDRALALVELGVGDRDARQLRELGQDRLVARAELAPVRVDDLEHAELLAAAREVGRQPRGLRLAAAQARGRGRGQRPQARVRGEDRDRRPARADDLARGVGGQLQDRLDRQRAVDRHRGVGERAQLLDVGVLQARDLLRPRGSRGGRTRTSRGSRAGSWRRRRAWPSSTRPRSASWCASARSSTLSCAPTASRPRS